MCGECGAINPFGRARSDEDAEYFRYARPYQLSGPEPAVQCTDVYRIKEACTSSGHPYWMHPGLVMIAGSGGTFKRVQDQWMVFFRVQDGFQVFSEAASSTMLFSDLDDFLAHLRANPEPE